MQLSLSMHIKMVVNKLKIKETVVEYSVFNNILKPYASVQAKI